MSPHIIGLVFSMLVISLALPACRAGNSKHKIEGASLRVYCGTTNHSPEPDSFYEVDRLMPFTNESNLILDISYDISWARGAWFSSIHPGGKGVADSIMNIDIYKIVEGDTLSIVDRLYGLRDMNFKIWADFKHGYGYEDWMDSGNNTGKGTLNTYKDVYNSCNYKSGIDYSALEGPILLTLDQEILPKRNKKTSFLSLTVLKSGTKIYSNTVDLVW